MAVERDAQDLKAARLARGRARLGGAPADARAVALEVLADAPGDPSARLLLGAALRRLGDPEAALEALSPLAAAQPGAWGVRFEVGAARLQAGDRPAAARELAEAVRLNRRTFLAHFALAEARGDDRADLVGRAELQAALSRVCAGAPDAGDQLDALGLGLADPLALQLLLEAAAAGGREPEALRALAAPLAAAPAFAPLARARAACLLADQRPAAALAGLEGLAEDTTVLALRAAALAQLGRADEAEALYARLLALAPEAPGVWLAWGHLLKAVGRDAAAAGAYRRTLAIAPGLGEAYWSLANLKVEPLGPADRAEIEARLAAGAASPEDEIALRFARARALEDAAAWPEAFAEYRQANAAAAARRPHDPDAHSAFVARSRALLAPALFARRGGAGDPSEAPIFIVGLPRAGTTLVEQILASHPEVEGLGELPEITRLARGLLQDQGAVYPELLSDLPARELARVGAAYLAAAAPYRRTGRPRFVDKAPGNALHLGLIALALPNARIVEVRRAPMAWGVSAFRQHFARGQAYSYDLGWLGRYYRDHAALMDHAAAVLPGRVHPLAYERLVEDPEGEVRRLLDYCGLPFTPDCLRFHETARVVRTPSAGQVRRPLSREGLDAWRRYEPWLEPLARALAGAGPAPAR